MICGALQTLNEEAFEDVINSERPSPTAGTSAGEMLAAAAAQLQLSTIRESSEFGSPTDEHKLNNMLYNNINYNNLNTQYQHQQLQQQLQLQQQQLQNSNHLNIDNNSLRSASAHSLQSLLTTGQNQHFDKRISGHSAGSISNLGTINYNDDRTLHKNMDFYNIRHNSISVSGVGSVSSGDGYVDGDAIQQHQPYLSVRQNARHQSISDDLQSEVLTLRMRTAALNDIEINNLPLNNNKRNNNSNSCVPTVVVIPNSNNDLTDTQL